MNNSEMFVLDTGIGYNITINQIQKSPEDPLKSKPKQRTTALINHQLQRFLIRVIKRMLNILITVLKNYPPY